MRGVAALLTHDCRCEVNHDGWVQYQALQSQNAKMRVEEAQARQQARRERKQQANADKQEYILSLAAARARRDEHIRNLAQEFAAKQARLEAVMLEADFRGEVPQPEAVEAALRDLPSGAPGAGASLALAAAVRAREGALEKARERASERREERERERNASIEADAAAAAAEAVAVSSSSSSVPAASAKPPSEAHLAQLQELGLDRTGALRALRETGGSSVAAAADWYFANYTPDAQPARPADDVSWLLG